MDAYDEIVKEVLTSAEVAMRVDSGVKLPGVESWLCHVLKFVCASVVCLENRNNDK